MSMVLIWRQENICIEFIIYLSFIYHLFIIYLSFIYHLFIIYLSLFYHCFIIVCIANGLSLAAATSCSSPNGRNLRLHCSLLQSSIEGDQTTRQIS